MKPEITVVMPVFNSDEFLCEAIDSILNQSHDNFEFLIIYDQSVDNSLTILNKYSKLDSRIRIINGNNTGISGALNKGLELSQAEFIARMDADDISYPDRFEKQLKYLNKNELDICGCHHNIIDDRGNLLRKYTSPITHESCCLSLAFEVPFAHPSVMIRKNFLYENNLRYGQSNFTNAEDYDLWVRMQAKKARFGNIDSILLNYRVLTNSLSRINNKKVLADTKALNAISFKENHSLNTKNISFILNNPNLKEESLVARFLLVNFFKRNSVKYSLIKKIKLKVVIYVFLSEVFRRFKFFLARA
jgi:glycosyltransferase involved in cell wall biosynthesis